MPTAFKLGGKFEDVIEVWLLFGFVCFFVFCKRRGHLSALQKEKSSECLGYCQLQLWLIVLWLSHHTKITLRDNQSETLSFAHIIKYKSCSHFSIIRKKNIYPELPKYSIQYNHITFTLKETVVRFRETDGKIKVREKTSDFKQQQGATLNDDSPIEVTVPTPPPLHSYSWELSLFSVQKQEEVVWTIADLSANKTRQKFKYKKQQQAPKVGTIIACYISHIFSGRSLNWPDLLNGVWMYPI